MIKSCEDYEVCDFQSFTEEYYRKKCGLISPSCYKYIFKIETEEDRINFLESNNKITRYDPKIIKTILAKENRTKAWYEKTTGKQVVETNLVISKKYPGFACTIDGDILSTKGIIEIKNPKKLSIFNLAGKVYRNQMEQVQTYMAILGKEWCDLIYFVNEHENFVKRIYFDKEYWKNLYSKVNDILKIKK